MPRWNAGAGIAAAEAGLAEAAAALAQGAPGADDRYAAALARFESASAGDFESRLSNTLAQVGLSPDPGDQPVATLSGGQEARRRAGRHPPLALRHHAARRADQRPRLRWAVPARGDGQPPARRHGDRLARPGLLGTHRDGRARARRAHPRRAPLRRRLGRLRVRAGHGACARSRGVRRVRVTSAPSCASGPSASGSGRRRVSHGRSASRGTTTRPNATSASSGPRISRDGPAAPSEHWTRSSRSRSRGRAGICGSPSARRPLGRCRGPAGGCGRGAGRLHARAVHGGHRLGRSRRPRRANGSGKTTLVDAAARPAAPALGHAPHGPRRRRRRAGPGSAHPAGRRPLADSFTRATGLPPTRPAASSPSSASGPTPCSGRRPRSRPVSAPGPSWRPSPRSA